MRHASVLYTADGHAHACAHEGAMYTHGHRDTVGTSAPTQPLSFYSSPPAFKTQVGSQDLLWEAFREGYLSPAHLPLGDQSL